MANNGKMNDTSRAVRDQRRILAESLATVLVMTQPAYSSAKAVMSRKGTDWVVEVNWARPGFKPRRYSLAELGSWLLSITPTCPLIQGR